MNIIIIKRFASIKLIKETHLKAVVAFLTIGHKYLTVFIPDCSDFDYSINSPDQISN